MPQLGRRHGVIIDRERVERAGVAARHRASLFARRGRLVIRVLEHRTGDGAGALEVFGDRLTVVQADAQGWWRIFGLGRGCEHFSSRGADCDGLIVLIAVLWLAGPSVKSALERCGGARLRHVLRLLHACVAELLLEVEAVPRAAAIGQLRRGGRRRWGVDDV